MDPSSSRLLSPAEISEHTRARRASAVAKLKRAASLPRMKDGRRPPMHTEAISEGEKQPDDPTMAGSSTTDSSRAVSPVPDTHVYSPQPHSDEPVPLSTSNATTKPRVEEAPVEPDGGTEADVELDEITPVAPEGPTSRSKRRTRSRSRSRGSKDLRRQRGAGTPVIPPSPAPDGQFFNQGDSSQEETVASPPPIYPPMLLPMFQPTPLDPRFLRSITPDAFLGYPGTSPPTPNLFMPSLEAIATQRGLFRSNSTGAARSLALAKLTGGQDTSEVFLASPASLLRNNTVSGGEERVAARRQMLSRLKNRQVVDGDAANTVTFTEDPRICATPSPTSRRRKKRRRRSSQANAAHAANSDNEVLSTTPNTPNVPANPLPSATPDNPVPSNLLLSSGTLSRTSSPLLQVSPGHKLAMNLPLVTPEPQVQSESNELPRRRSVLVEDDEDYLTRPQPEFPADLRVHGTLAPLPPPPVSSPHAPSALPHNHSPISAAGSPFANPLQENQLRDDGEEEQVLYGDDTVVYDDDAPRQRQRSRSWISHFDTTDRIPVNDTDGDESTGESTGRQVEPDNDEDAGQHRSDSFSPTYDDNSRPASVDYNHVVVETEGLRDTATSPSVSSGVALSHHRARASTSDDLSVASPHLYIDNTPSSSQPGGEYGSEAQRSLSSESLQKRSADRQPRGAWAKVKQTLRNGARRSRSNSIIQRHRDHTDSSVSRESAASSTFAQQQGQPPIALNSPKLSLAPQMSPHDAISPIPAASEADLVKYSNSKLFPFPGMMKLEEKRRAKGLQPASVSNPDISSLVATSEDEQPRSAGLYTDSSGMFNAPESGRERKLSHQFSDTNILPKFLDGSDFLSHTPTPANMTTSKLPRSLADVRTWLGRNNKKKTTPPSTVASSPQPPLITVPMLERPTPQSAKKPSLSELLQLSRDNSPTRAVLSPSDGSQSGSASCQLHTPPREAVGLATEQSSPTHTHETTDTDKTLKTSRISPPEDIDIHQPSLSSFDQPSLMSPKDALSSTTPDPTSSLSDYPARSTSETSSISSRFSPPAVIVLDQKTNGEERHGSIILQRLDESLARGSRSPMWASAIDEPSRKLLMSSPVLQVVNANTVKDRFLFLFTDLLVIAKPVFEDPATIDDRHFSDVYGPSPTNRRFIIKNVVLLRHLRFHDDLSADLASKTDAPPRNPRLRLFVHQFNQDPEHAVLTLFLSVKGSHNPRLLGQLLFKTLDLDRARLGQYLSMKGSKVVLKAFLDNFGFLGLRIDRALRAFLLSIHVDPSSSSFDYLVDAFASRWYEANAGILAYDKDLALRLVRALVQLNEAIHGGLAEEYGPGHYPSRYVPSKEFVSAFRRFDPKNLISNQFLEDVYVSIAENQLAQARNPLSARTDLTIAVKRPIPTRLTYKVKSDPVVLRIPNPDNDFSISLFGDGLVFDPPCLTFTKSCEASFRITGVALGPKTMIMCRSGRHALAYGRLPLSSTITVGRAFMRNTFQLAFSDHKGNKRRYMFSVDDHLLRHQWATRIEQQISERSTPSPQLASGTSLKFYRAAEAMAFNALRDTLIGDDSPGPETMDSSRLNGDQRPGRGLAEDRTLPFHARSKSRSKVYHQYGAGRNELELGNGDDTEGNSEQSLRLAGKTWSVEDIELQCQQNSSIALVLSYLQVGTPSAP